MLWKRPNRIEKRQLVALAVMAVIGLGADAIVTPTLNTGEDEYAQLFVMSISLGLLIGQINLISIWAALAPGRLVVRLPWALLLTAVMWAMVCIEFNRRGVAAESHYQAGLILVCAQLAAQTPLWAGAKIWKWRLASRDSRRVGIDVSDAQFSIRHMMLGTLLLAITLSLFRLIISGRPADWLQVLIVPHTLVILVGAATTNLLIVVPCIWLAFLPRQRLPRMLAMWGLFVVLMSIVEIFVLTSILWSPQRPVLTYVVTIVINLTQCGLVVWVLMRLRRLGFRLVRLKNSS
jgi:hypothetical protein